MIRIGAVNCQDDNFLCRQQNIRGYPSLILFGPGGPRPFRGRKERSDLIDFVVAEMPNSLFQI